MSKSPSFIIPLSWLSLHYLPTSSTWTLTTQMSTNNFTNDQRTDRIFWCPWRWRWKSRWWMIKISSPNSNKQHINWRSTLIFHSKPSCSFPSIMPSFPSYLSHPSIFPSSVEYPLRIPFHICPNSPTYNGPFPYPPNHPQQHFLWFYKNADIFISVHNIIYGLHRIPFVQSPVFRQILETVIPPYNHPLGLTKALPIPFNNVDQKAFISIINILHYSNYDFNPPEEIWKRIKKLAIDWDASCNRQGYHAVKQVLNWSIFLIQAKTGKYSLR